MKPLFLFLAVLFFCASGIAQADINYKGPGKMEVQSFWRQNEMFKNGKGTETTLDNMKRSIDNLKQKDPAYNTGEMETEFNKWKAALEKKQAEKDANDQKSGEATKARNQLITAMAAMNNDVTDCFHRTLPSEEADIEEFKVKVKEILDRKDILKEYKEHYKDGYYETMVIEMKSASDIPLSREINTVCLEIDDAKSGDESDWKQPYFRIQGLKAYWEAAEQVFPDIPECAEASKKCKLLAGKYGTMEQIKAKTMANKAAAMKERRLPAPVVKDAALEKILVEGFDKKYGPAYNAKAVKAVLTQDGWTTERNEITGIVTGRNRTGKIAYKTTEGDGKCYLLSGNIFIYEEYIGGSFTNTRVIYNGLGGEEMLCENVK